MSKENSIKAAMKGIRINVQYVSPIFVLRYNQEGSNEWRLPHTPEGDPIVFDDADALENYLQHSGLIYAKRMSEMLCGPFYARKNPVIETTEGLLTGTYRRQVWVEEKVTYVHWQAVGAAVAPSPLQVLKEEAADRAVRRTALQPA